ncbi:hypothetical protein WA158_008010 [Blastocystis sp. Blastoise]
MGSSPSKPITTYAVVQSLFNSNEIEHLRKIYVSMSRSEELQNCYIVSSDLYAFFQKIIKCYNKTILQRMAQVFSSEYNDCIRFQDFVVICGILTRNNCEEFRIKLLFQMFDLKGDEFFDIEEFKQIYPYFLVYQDNENAPPLDIGSGIYMIIYISTITSSSTKTKIALPEFSKYVLEEETFVKLLNTWKSIKLFN